MLLTAIRPYIHLIQSYRIIRFEQAGLSYRLRAEVTFNNGSQLYIRETVIEATRKYAYHWQDDAQNLLIRWDNAPDWEVDTFPHHKHVAIQTNVLPSYERTLP